MFYRYTLLILLILQGCSSTLTRSPAAMQKTRSCREIFTQFLATSRIDLYDRFVGKLHSSQLLDTPLVKLNNRPSNKIENYLSNSPIKEFDHQGLGASGSTKPILIILEDGTKAVWKPHKRIKLSNYRTEVLAYELDMKFGIGLVPPTVERKIKGEVGSVQLFKDGTAGVLIDYHKRNGLVSNTKRLEMELRKQSLFDYIIENNDRNANNFLFSKDGRVISIDNASSFTGHGHHFKSFESRREDISIFLKSREGRDIISKIENSLDNNFEDEMINYLGYSDAKRFFVRIDTILELYRELI